MTIFELGALGEFVGAIAVVGTLIYLAVQIRQNTSQIRDNVLSLQVNAYQDLINRIADVNKLVISDGEWASIAVKAAENPTELDSIELVRYMAYLMMLTRHADMAYLQYEKGMLDHERFLSALGPFYGLLRSSELARAHLRDLIGGGGVFTQSFLNEMTTILDGIDEGEKRLSLHARGRDLVASLDQN